MIECHQPLTDSQWQVMARLLPISHKRRHCLRQLIDALRYTSRTGCQWRCLPACFPPWSAVYYYFRRWQLTGLQQLNEAVVQADHLIAQRPATPSLVYLDSQSVRLASRIFEHRGLDGSKRVNGRKRQLITDVQGRILACRVHAANGHDGVQALALLPAWPLGWGQRLVTVVTNKGYRGRFARHLARLGLTHQVGSRLPSEERGFVPVAKRWVVERTFYFIGSRDFGGWLSTTNSRLIRTKPGCLSPT